MKADWLLMRDVRDELTKLHSRWREMTGSDAAYEAFLLDAWENVCRIVEDERALNGGNRVRSLRTKPVFKPDIHIGSGMLTRELSARNYVGRPKWDILVDRVLRGMLAEWTKLSPPSVRREEFVRKQEPPKSPSPSPSPSSSR